MKTKNTENKKMLLAYKIIRGLSILLIILSSFTIAQDISEGIPFYVKSSIFGMMIGLLLFSSSSLNIKRLEAGRQGKMISDERSRHVAEKSGLLAFLLLIIMLLVSGIVNIMFDLNLSYTITVYVILTVSVLFWILFIYYLDKKGVR